MDNSPLGQVPPEIREQIWELALIEAKPIALRVHLFDSVPCYLHEPWIQEDCSFPALTRVCKQIYKEAAPAYWRVNRVWLGVDLLLTDPHMYRIQELDATMQSWFSARGRHVRHLRHLTVEFTRLRLDGKKTSIRVLSTALSSMKMAFSGKFRTFDLLVELLVASNITLNLDRASAQEVRDSAEGQILNIPAVEKKLTDRVKALTMLRARKLTDELLEALEKDEQWTWSDGSTASR